MLEAEAKILALRPVRPLAPMSYELKRNNKETSVNIKLSKKRLKGPYSFLSIP